MDDTVLGEVRLESARDIDRLAQATFHEDGSLANGSSIVLLAEHDGRRCLLGGDAYAADVLAAVQLLAGDTDDPLVVDAWELAHHGGEKNTSAELIAAIETSCYIISTSGVRYGHPKPETLARVLTHRPGADTPRFVFNYRSKTTTLWDDPSKFAPEYTYEPVYPEQDGTQILAL